MKTLTVLMLVTLTFLSLNCITLGAEENVLPPEPDYIGIIKQKYKEAETSEVVTKSWAPGMLKDYGLVFDHIEMQYTETAIQKTTDGKTLVCGNLLITAYGKTLDGGKKRVLSLRSLCHLFSKETLEKVLVIDKQGNKLLNGWDDFIIV